MNRPYKAKLLRTEANVSKSKFKVLLAEKKHQTVRSVCIKEEVLAMIIINYKLNEIFTESRNL